MIVPLWMSDGKAATKASLEEMAQACGRRSAVLAALSGFAGDLGFSVPNFFVIPADFAREVNGQYEEVESEERDSAYLALSEKRTSAYQALLKPHLTEIASAVETLTSSNPILRGSSSLEGINSLSFAGVCKTAIPRQDIALKDYLQAGVGKVLAGSFTPYADYYISHHDIPRRGRDVSLIVMEMVTSPIIHATAYAYPDEIRIRYFLNPTVGSCYIGGHEMILMRAENLSAQLPDHTQEFRGTWQHIADVLWNLQDYFYGEPTPIDVEFIINQSDKGHALHIVQMRPVSRPHEKNYLQAKAISGLPLQTNSRVVIPPSHLYHSVGEVTEGSAIDLRDVAHFPDLGSMIEGVVTPVFLISHEGGEGTFSFLKALPNHFRKGTVLITHPENRQHDHLQYSAYEDRRLDMIVHCDERAITNIVHGDAITLISNGEMASLEIKEKH